MITESARAGEKRCLRRSQRFVRAIAVAGFSATLMLSSNAFADELQNAPDYTAADKKYDDCIAFRKAGKLNEAHACFTEAWTAEKSARIAGMLGQTELELGHYREAIEHFQFYVQHKEPNEEDRERAEKLLAEAQSKVSVLEVRVNTPEVEILVDQMKVGVTPLSHGVLVNPGKRLVEARKDGCIFDPASIEFAPGAKRIVSFMCKKPFMAPTPGPDVARTPRWKYVVVPLAIGVGVGGAIFGTVQHGRATELSATADRRLAELTAITSTSMNVCGAGSPSTNVDKCQKLHSLRVAKDEAVSLSIAGFVVAGVGAAVVVASVLWPKQRSDKIQVAPAIASSEGGILVRGTF